MLSCDGELKADEYWMSAETSWVCDVAIAERDMGVLLISVIVISGLHVTAFSFVGFVWKVGSEAEPGNESRKSAG